MKDAQLQSIPSKTHSSKDKEYHNNKNEENILENELKNYKQQKSQKRRDFQKMKEKKLEKENKKIKNNQNCKEEYEIRNILGIQQSKNNSDLYVLNKEKKSKSNYGKLKKKFEMTNEYQEKFQNLKKDGNLKLNNPINLDKTKIKKSRELSNGNKNLNKHLNVIYKPNKDHLIAVNENEESADDKNYLNSYPDKFKLYESG